MFDYLPYKLGSDINTSGDKVSNHKGRNVSLALQLINTPLYIAKKLCEPFNYWLERLFTELFTDFHWCKEHVQIMKELCFVKGMNLTLPQRFVSHRWLYDYNKSVETSHLLEMYISALFPIHMKEIYAVYDLSCQQLTYASDNIHGCKCQQKQANAGILNADE